MSAAREELAALVRAAQACVGRRAALGERRSRAAAGRAPARAEPRPEPEARPEPPTHPSPAPARPPATVGAPFETTLPRPRSEPGAVAELRARAAACADLGSLREAVAACTACALCRTRTQTVFADGDGPSRVMFVGEAPGFHEDAQGVPFVGRAGQLLSDIIEKGMGLARRDVYIANVLKCRPPDNRDPSVEEKALCTPWLDRQIELVDPEVIVPLGRHAAGHLLGSEASMGRLRGRVHARGRRRVVPTYHPAYLLRSPERKRECWEDIQLAMKELGLEPPPRARR